MNFSCVLAGHKAGVIIKGGRYFLRLRDLTIALVVTILTVAGIMAITQRVQRIDNQLKANDQEISTLLTREEIEPLKQKINELETRIEELEAQVYRNAETISEVRENSISRSGARSRIMRVTAYSLAYEDCKKHPDHPEYGETASGYMVQEWHTIAAGPELKFGTKVYIPYFRERPNGGIFTVEDRGSAIRNGCIDVFMPDGEDCRKFGVRYLEVYLLPDDDGRY
jgi:3D (Asp-Asp-Asp) domain-containing protein